MKKISLLLAAAITLSACGSHPAEQAASAPAQEQVPAKLKTLPLAYADYKTAVNKGLVAQKTGLALPEHAVPSDTAEGKKLLYDFSDGLTLTLSTDKSDKISEIRVVWDTDTAPDKAEKLSKAAAALITASSPEDPTLLRDTNEQIKMAIDSHNEKRDPTREWVRSGVAYKVTVTNLPSVVLTAKPE